MVFEHKSSCNKCTIRKTTIFSSLTNAELANISKMIQTINFRKKEAIFSENSQMTDIYLVKNGIIKVYKSVQDGRQQILRLCGLGDILGLDSAHGHSKNVLNTLRKVKDAFPDLQVIAGNVATAEGAEDLIKAGVIDPTKVTRIALENAASIASMLLTTECVLSEHKDENAAPAPAMPPMGGGMPGMM